MVTTAREPYRRTPMPPMGPARDAATAPGRRKNPVAVALALPDGYFTDFGESMRRRRDLLVDGLTDAGFGVYAPEGTYFVTADVTPLGGRDGVEFCRSLPERCGVVAVPTRPKAAAPATRSAEVTAAMTCSARREMTTSSARRGLTS